MLKKFKPLNNIVLIKILKFLIWTKPYFNFVQVTFNFEFEVRFKKQALLDKILRCGWVALWKSLPELSGLSWWWKLIVQTLTEETSWIIGQLYRDENLFTCHFQNFKDLMHSSLCSTPSSDHDFYKVELNYLTLI